MIRRVICAVVIALIWLVVFGWSANVVWTSPPLAHKNLSFDAVNFHVVGGAGVEDGTSLRVGSVGDDGSAMQAAVAGHIRAEDFPVLRYRFEEFPRTLELSFFFRRADAPDDVQPAVTVPWPGDGWQTLDLRKVPGWSGDIIEFGFAEYGTPQIAPPNVQFKPFRFDAVEFWSPSWRGSFAALYTSWFSYTPWALLSISALGPQREVAQAPSLICFAVIGVMLSLFVAALILRWTRARIVRFAIATAVVLWAVFDAIWLIDLRAKHEFTENLYAGKSWEDRERLIPDRDIEQAATDVRAFLSRQGTPRRLLVGADSKYVFLKLIYYLLPLDAAPLQQAVNQEWPLRDTYVLLFRDSQWRYDALRGALVDKSGFAMAFPESKIFSSTFERPLRIVPVFETGDVRLYAFRPGRAL